MKTISANLDTHLNQTVTTLASCWKITRTDGVAFHFTDHDQDLTISGDEYESSRGFSRTAVENTSAMKVDNTDVEGILESDSITEEDLRAGKFDYAEVEVFLVNWADVSQGIMKMRKGWFGEISISQGGVFRTELRGLMQGINQKIIRSYGPLCDADLGDSRCKIDIDPTLRANVTAYSINEYVSVNTLGDTKVVTNLSMGDNMSFESDAAADDYSTITGWTVTQGLWDIKTSSDGLGSDHGTRYLMGGGGTGLDTIIYQDIDIAFYSGYADSIDDNLTDAVFTIRRAQSNATDQGRVEVEALDADKNVLGVIYDSGMEEITPTDTWVTRTNKAASVGASSPNITVPVANLSITTEIPEAYDGGNIVKSPAAAQLRLSTNSPVLNPVPVLTRYIRIRLTAQPSGTNSTAFDNCSLVVNHYGVTTTQSERYEDRIYICANGGESAATQPTFNTVIGGSTVDGTVTWTAVQAWQTTGAATLVSGKSIVFDSNYAGTQSDDFYNGGVLIWETGKNEGRAIEIRDYEDVSGKFTLFLPMAFDIEVGDIFRVYRGCNKDVAACRDIFDNMDNFRGFPHIPGVDSIGAYPDAK
jgi:uncharacterized phage protein (TIGR02218 family)